MGRQWIQAACAACALLASGSVCAASPEDPAGEAAALFSRGDYVRAVARIEDAVRADSLNAELHYLLGYYTHYLCNDSRPLVSCDEQASNRVLAHLERALALAPEHGNAAYFIGAERGARARRALGRGDVAASAEEFRSARAEGALPDWLMEYARNVLRSCETGTILFACGDPEVNPVQYLQIVEGERADVTMVPLPFLDVPWYARMLARGVPAAIAPAPIAWSEEQILSMRPFKWKPNDVTVPVSAETRRQLGLAPSDTLARWTVEPDLTGTTGGFLSASHALLLHIIETNAWSRPVCFTLGCASRAPELAAFLETRGLAERLLPVETEPRGRSIDAAFSETILLDAGNFRDLPDVSRHDMPRVSPMLQNYRAVFMSLAAQRAGQGDNDGARKVLAAMDRTIPENVLPFPPPLREAVDGLRKQIEQR